MEPLNAEFCRLLQKSGWTQAEASRRLRISSGVVSQYVKGSTRPSETVISLLKILTGDKTPMPGEPAGADILLEDAPTGLAEWEAALLNQIRELPDEVQRLMADEFGKLAALYPRRPGD